MSIRKNISARINKGENYLIIAVGDSVTWGLSHCSEEETYCAGLAKLFAKSMPEAKVVRYDGIVKEERRPLYGYSEPKTVQSGSKGTLTIVKCGVGGDTVQRAINRFDDYSGEFINGKSPDLFLLMFGINDALASDPDKFVSPERFYNNYSVLSDMLKNSNPNAEIVLMTPTYNDEGTGTQSCLDTYCEKVIELARQKGFQYIDTHKLWMEHLIVGSDNYGQRDWLSGAIGDTCHFSKKGAANAANYIFSELDKEQ